MEFLPFEREATLMAEKIYMENVTAPDFILLKNNFLFVSSSRSDSMLSQYSLPNMKLLYQGVLRDKQKMSLLFFRCFAAVLRMIYIFGGNTPLSIKCFSVDETGKLSLQKKYAMPYYESFNQMHIFHDSILVYSAIPNDFAIKKINLNRGEEIGKN